MNGVFNKLGFQYRTLHEWTTQVKNAFQSADGIPDKIKSTVKTAFTVQKSSIKSISKDDFVNVFKRVQNTHIPTLSGNGFMTLTKGISADDFFNSFNMISPKSSNAITEWFNQFETMDKTMKDYLTECINDKAPASFDNYNKYVQKAIEQNNKFSLSAKVSKLAVQGLAMVGNMLLMWGLGSILSYAIEKLNEFANAAKISKEKAASFAKSVNASMIKFSENSTTLASLSKEYEELSKGVNALGDNISLSASQYDRYKEVITQISEIMPNLTTYFNSQGEAIGFTKGKLTDLNGEYRNYIQNRAKEFLVNGDSEGNTFQDAIDNFTYNSKYGFWTELVTYLKHKLFIYDENDLPVDTLLPVLQELQSKSQTDMAAYFNQYDVTRIGLVNSEKNDINGILVKILEVNADDINKMNDEAFHQLQLKIATYIEQLQNDYTTDMLSVTAGLLQSAYSKDAFWTLDESLKNDVTTMLSSINADVWKALGYNTSIEAEAFVNTIIQNIAQNKDGFTDAWNELFTLDETTLNANEYIAKVNNLIDIICNVLGIEGEENRRNFMLSLGFDTDIEQGMLNGLKEKLLSSEKESLPTSGAVSAIGITASEEDLTVLNWINSLNRSELELANSDAFLDALETQRQKLVDTSLSAADYNTALEEVKNAQQTNSTTPWDYSKTVAELNSAREKFDVLNRSLTELNQNDGQLDFEDLSAIHEAFSDLSGIDSYIRKLQEAGGNTEAINAVMQDLVNEYLNYSGILDHITDENAGLVVSALEEMGVANAQLLITEQLAAAKEYLALTGKRVEESELGEIAAVLAGTEISQTAAENLAKLTLAKLNLNEQRINSDDDIEHIIAIANAAGASAEYLDVMRNSLRTLAVFGNGQKEKITVNENQLVSGGFGGAISDFYYRKFIEPAQKSLSEIINELASVQLDPEKYKADYKGGIINDAAKAAGDAVETDWREALDHCLNLYRAELDSGLIEFSDFLDKSRSQIEKFYSDGKISVKDYWDYVGNLYEEKLSGYDRVISAVADRIDEEIDALEKQKEASEQSYQVKIDAIQEEIDKLEEANKKREEQIDLESAQWELERARNQRTKAVFNGSEKIYTADTEKIRKAQEDLEDKEFRLHISDLESQIQSLEEEMKQASNTIDDQIAKLKDYKEQWQSVADAYEKSRDRMYADQILGQNWEAEILSGRIETLNAFKEQYIAIQQAIADAAWHSAAEQIKAGQAAQNGTAGNTESAGSPSGSQNPAEEKDPVTGKTIASALRPQKYAAAQKSPSNGYLPVHTQNELWEKCKNLLPNAPGILSPASLLPLTGYSYGSSIRDNSVSVTIGDIHLHNVQNTDSLSRAILKELPGRLTQAVSHN